MGPHQQTILQPGGVGLDPCEMPRSSGNITSAGKPLMQKQLVVDIGFTGAKYVSFGLSVVERWLKHIRCKHDPLSESSASL